MIVAGAAGADGEGLAPVDAADGLDPVAVGGLVPAGAVRRRWADRRRSPLGPNRCRSPSPLRSSASREGAAVGRLPSERAAPSGRG